MDDVRANTVPSKAQTDKCVFCDGKRDGHIKLMFLGNSITYHARKDDLGWFKSCGMAASSPDKDYVHRLEAMLKEAGEDVDKCVVNVAEWERDYKTGREVLARGIYEDARNFGADVTIIRLLENCPPDNWDREAFKTELLAFMDYFDPEGKAKYILTTSFWRHIGSEVIEEIAREKGIPCIPMTDLGDRDDMKALGEYAHDGVARHPGDKGMENIAERLLPAVLDEIKKIRG